MTRMFLFGAAAALGLLVVIATADAQSWPRQAPQSLPPPPGYLPPGYVPAAPRGPSRPPWAQPNECYIDEGYGRFSPCR